MPGTAHELLKPHAIPILPAVYTLCTLLRPTSGRDDRWLRCRGTAEGGAAAHARFPASIELFGHTLSIGTEIAIMVAFGAIFIGLAIRGFSRTQ